MSTTTRPSRGKPVTLAKSASGEPVPTKAAKGAKVSKPATKTADKTAETIQKTPKPESKASHKPTLPALISSPAEPASSDFAFQTKWNELVKAQSEAALAWWQDAKDAKTFVDALAVNARHTRLQFEMAAGQAREMADLVQKSFEGNAERMRSFLAPLSSGH